MALAWSRGAGIPGPEDRLQGLSQLFRVLPGGGPGATQERGGLPPRGAFLWGLQCLGRVTAETPPCSLLPPLILGTTLVLGIPGKGWGRVSAAARETRLRGPTVGGRGKEPRLPGRTGQMRGIVPNGMEDSQSRQAWTGCVQCQAFLPGPLPAEALLLFLG